MKAIYSEVPSVNDSRHKVFLSLSRKTRHALFYALNPRFCVKKLLKRYCKAPTNFLTFVLNFC